MADQQEALERLRELYREKNEHLEKFLEPVEPYEFYREIFPEGSFERKGHFEDRKGNGIAVTVTKGEVDRATVPDFLFWAAAVRQKCQVSLCSGV